MQKSVPYVNNLFSNIVLRVLTQEQKQDSEKEISEKEVFDAIKSFSNNKSLGTDSLTKDIYEAFWNELKEPFMNSISQTKISEKLFTSHR